MTKAVFNRKRTFYQQSTRKFEEETSEFLFGSPVFYGAETRTLRKVDQKYLESFKMWCWRRMEKIIWTTYVRNEEVLLKSQGGEKYPTHNKKEEG
jgi:hypothetical protein